MANGIVKWAVDPNSPDVFVLHSGINATGFKSLADGDHVTFDIEQGQKGPAAVNVTVV